MSMDCAAWRVLAPVAAVLLIGGGGGAPGANPAASSVAATGSRQHVHAESTRSHNGRSELTSLDVDGPARLERTCQADLCHGSWFDGYRSVVIGINGAGFHERQRDDALERTFSAIESTAFAGPDFLARGGRVEELAGSTDDRVQFRVVAPDGPELIAVADRRSRRLVAVLQPDGTLFANLVATGEPPALVYGARSYDRVDVISQRLTPPAGPAVHVADVREVPLLAAPLPIVACRLAGRDAACLIDSGTTPSAITLAFAERLEREPRGSIEIAAMGSYLTGVVDAGPLEVGGADFPNLHFAVLPHTRGPAFDIILGSDALSGLRIDLDPGHGSARIAASGDGDLGAMPIPLEFSGGLPYVNARLAAGQPDESMLVDTGDSGTVAIGYDRYRTDPNLFVPAGHVQATGAGAPPMDALTGLLDHVDLGPAGFDRVPIVAVRGEHHGHIGYGFAARCGRFTLDFGRRAIACRGALGDASKVRARQ